MRADHNGQFSLKEWWEDLLDDAKEWLEEEKENAEENPDGTIILGSCGGAGAFVAGSRSFGVTADQKGNVGVITNNAAGLGSTSASVCFFFTVTDAPRVNAQAGRGFQMGGSASYEFVTAGAEYVVMFDDINNTTYNGITGMAGFCTPGAPIEAHFEFGSASVYSVNIFDVACAFLEWLDFN